MTLDQIVSIYGWPLTLVSGFAICAFLFYALRRIIDGIRGKKR